MKVKVKLMYAALMMPFLVNAQEYKNILDKVNIYADVAPLQLIRSGESNKVAYSLAANYSVLPYLGIGLAFNSIPGFGNYFWNRDENVRSNNFSIDLRPKYEFGKSQVFIFGQFGLPLNELKDKNMRWPIAKVYCAYSVGIGYGYKFNKYTGIQINFKIANIIVEHWRKENYQSLLSIGYFF